MTAASRTESWATHNLRTSRLSTAGFVSSVCSDFSSVIRNISLIFGLWLLLKVKNIDQEWLNSNVWPMEWAHVQAKSWEANSFSHSAATPFFWPAFNYYFYHLSNYYPPFVWPAFLYHPPFFGHFPLNCLTNLFLYFNSSSLQTSLLTNLSLWSTCILMAYLPPHHHQHHHHPPLQDLSFVRLLF